MAVHQGSAENQVVFTAAALACTALLIHAANQSKTCNLFKLAEVVMQAPISNITIHPAGGMKWHMVHF